MALDLVEGQPPGHAIRTCLIAQQVGNRLQLESAVLKDLLFSALLKDSGCSNNSVRIHHIFGGDEIESKRAVKVVDWSQPLESLKFGIYQTEKGKGVGAKLKRLAANLGPPSQIMKEVTAARCNRGADIARKLGLGDRSASAIQCLDEHWDGKGAPVGISGQEIPLESLILGAAQTADVFQGVYGSSGAKNVIATRSGTWFSPEVSAAMLDVVQDTKFWNALQDENRIQSMAKHIFDVFEDALEADLDDICEAFGMIVDAKSSFTWQHSARVAKYSCQIAVEMGVPLQDIVMIRRAAMVHDIGKLGISSSILEKPDRLTDEEIAIVRDHPRFSYEILSRVPSFEAITEIASAHHERLDGKGYWRGLGSEKINLHTRIVTVADVFDALTAARPYKEPMPVEMALGIMERDSGTAFDPACLNAIRQGIGDDLSTDLAA